MINQHMNMRQWMMLALLSVIWGGAFIFVEVALTAFPPFSVATMRVAVSAIALWAVLAALKSAAPSDPKVWRDFFIMGTVNNAIPFSLIVWGQSHISASLASILIATTPLFTVVIAHFATRDEKISGGRLVGVLLGMAGVVMMIGVSALEGLGSHILAQLAMLGAACGFAVSGIFGRRFAARKIQPLLIAAGQLTAASILMVPMALALDRPWTLPPPSTEAIGAVLALALVSTAAAYLLYFRLLATAGATNSLLVTFLIPVSAITLGAVLLGERLQYQHFTGMALIAIGLAAIDGRFLNFLRRASTHMARSSLSQ